MNDTIKKIFQKLILGCVFSLIIKIKGIHNIPKNGGYIIASNHTSHIDPFTIGSIIFRKTGIITSYIGKKESLNTAIGNFIYNVFDVVPIDRGSKSEKWFKTALRILKNGGIIGIFPEGTRSFPGSINKGKTGVIRLAIASKKPVLPVAIKGTYQLWPRYKKLPSIKRTIQINIGVPVTYNTDKKTTKKYLRTLTDSLMNEIRTLYIKLK